jgi:hypothetical protein
MSSDHLEPGLQGQTMPDDLKSEMLAMPYSEMRWRVRGDQRDDHSKE